MNPKNIYKRSALLWLILAAIALADNRGLAQAANDPESNFEFVWKTCDLNYALFDAKRIDWQALYNVYRPQVTAQTGDDEIFAVLSRMLGHLNDNHVRLTSTSPQRFFGAGYLQVLFAKSGIAKMKSLLRVRPVPDKNFKAPLKESANAYDSLAEAYMTAGNTRLAIRNYEQSMKLNPRNEKAVAMLKKLRGEK